MKEIMKEGKTVYDESGDIIFSQPRYYSYILDDTRSIEDIITEYLKWHHEFYGESGNIHDNRFSDKNVTEKIKLLLSSEVMKLPVIIKCTFYFVTDGTSEGNYIFHEVDENGHYTDKKTGEYPCYCKPKRKDRDEFPNGDMLMASELTGVYGPAIFVCKVKIHDI